MPRFVVLHHRLPDQNDRPTHWDLMLEMGDALRCWALPNEPLAGRQFYVESLPDHRLLYLEYEGPVSGNRGHVSRWDHGEFQWIERHPDRLVAVLKGVHQPLRIQLTRQDADQRWLFAASSDDSAIRGD